MQLRTYQEIAVKAAREALQATDARVCLVSPTGSGKSIICATIAEQYTSPLWLAPTVTLRDQLRSYGHRATTYQAMLAGERIDADLLICDECHHAPTAERPWGAAIARYSRILGATATPARADGQGYRGQYDHLVVAANYSELLADGYLVPVNVVRPVDTPEEVTGLAEHPVRAWERFARRRRGYAYFGRVELAQRFQAAMGARCAVITGDTLADEREAVFARFRSGEISCLANVQTLTEGLDIPEADVCMLCCQLSSEAGYLQRVGRVMRPAPGKTDALLIDLPGASFRYGLPSDNRIYSLDGEAIRLSAGLSPLSQCLACAAVYKSSQICPRCGWVRPVEVTEPKIWKCELEKIDMASLSPENRAKAQWKLKLQADSEKRTEWLAKAIAAHGLGSAVGKFRGAFKRWPDEREGWTKAHWREYRQAKKS